MKGWFRWAIGGAETRIDLRNDYSSERDAVRGLLDGPYDLALCFRYRAATVLPAGAAGHVVTDYVDWDADAFSQAAAARWRTTPTPRNLWDVVAARRDQGNLRRSMARAGAHTDLWVAASDKDRDAFGLPTVRTLPNAYPRPTAPLVRVDEGPVILLAATYDYFPNLEGARWFVKNVLPRVRVAVPDARVRLVGRGRGQLGLRDAPGVEVVGEVPDIAPELGRATIVIAPMRWATATRLKVMEAWAYRVPVVATTPGAAGLDAEPGRHYLRADDPVAFADACVSLLTDPGARTRLVDAGHRFYEARWSEDAFAHGLAQIVDEVMALPPRRAG
jgi:glycosyltransferase involved in cell wall biosynthesis